MGCEARREGEGTTEASEREVRRLEARDSRLAASHHSASYVQGACVLYGSGSSCVPEEWCRTKTPNSRTGISPET